MGSRDLFVVRKLEISRKPTMKAYLDRAASKLSTDGVALVPVVERVEKVLRLFGDQVAGDERQIVRPTVVPLNRVENVLRKLDEAANPSRALKGIEKPILLRLLQEHLTQNLIEDQRSRPGAESRGINSSNLIEHLSTFLFLLDRVQLTASERANAERILRRPAHRPASEEYHQLANDLVKIWSEHGVPIGRSAKGSGVFALTEGVLSQLNFSVKLYPKFDPAGKPYGPDDGTPISPSRKPIFELSTVQLIEEVRGPLDTAVREFMVKRETARLQPGNGGWQ